MNMVKLGKDALPILFILVGFCLNAQKIGKLYDQAEDLFYSENLIDALEGYQLVLAQDPTYEDAEYKAELCSLLTSFREKPLDKILSYESTIGAKDRFYNYWLGRIYVDRYMYIEAVDVWKKFLKAKTRKSLEIRDETKEFISDARKKLVFFDNTDDYEIHQLGGEINTEGAELSPAYFEAKDELIFASSRGTSGRDESFKIYHSIKQDDGWTDITEVAILGQFTRQTANIEVVDEDGKLFLFSPKNKGDLFYSETTNGKWTLPVEFDSKVTSTHLKSHFHINEHEDRIIFATEAKKSGLDLFQTFRNPKSGKWSKPAPFADIINSDFVEDSPFLSKDEKTLYFSSDGHGSIGGYDVYKTVFDSATLKWSEPINLGFPINSPDDEMHFKLNPDGSSGYFSSNRLHTKGDFDIYFFWEVEKIQIEGRVFDVTAQSSIPDAQIRFTPSAYTDEHFRSAIDPDGKYETEIISDETYLVEVIKDGKTLYTDQFEIHETGGVATTYIKDFLFNKPILKDQPPVETAQAVVSSKKNPTTKESTARQKPTTTSTNDRREVVRETKPVNRSKSKPTNNSKSAGTTNTSNSDIQRMVANYNVGSKVIIQNIYFGFGTTGLTQSEQPVLEELLSALQQNKNVKVEIGGHTDNTGPADANLWISENRAKSVKKWLVTRGVASNRIMAKGYGESEPLASNDDEEGGRELNRRIEVRLIR